MKKSLLVGAILTFSLTTYSGITLAQEIQTPSPSEVQGDGWTLIPEGCTGKDAHNPEVCGFDQFIQLIANIMGALMVIALSLATILFSFAGFKYVTAAGNPSQIESAKKVFLNVAIGLAVVFGAYLLIQVLVSVLGVDNNFNIFLEKSSFNYLYLLEYAHSKYL